MSSKRRHEGYVLIDHTDSPGVPDAMAHKLGLPAKSTKYEAATITCSHCAQILFLNPDRTRSRGYCRKCDHYICDRCTTVMAKTLQCVPIKKLMDDALEAAALQEQRGSIILVK